ncbi:MAG: hypothetical protein OEX81_00185 [Candidatus Pacebacteria bacterium]|nr:hypothetical protein [Candidatus Paceibacterota bacterium]
MKINLSKHIETVIKAHVDHPKEEINKYRFFDKKTPYVVHPIWCATTILTEPKLDFDLRQKGALSLLYHDVLEDTLAPLPEDLPSEIKEWIRDMTFDGGFEEEQVKLFTKPKEVLLFKLYDKTSNLLDATWMDKELYKTYFDFTQKLSKKVTKHYGELNITKILGTLKYR